MAPGIRVELEDAPNIDLGANLKALRETNGLTIRALADLSGLNVNTLSLIENGKSSPSVNTLQQIAHALNAPIVALFEQEHPNQSIRYSRSATRRRAAFEHGFLDNLGNGMPGCPFEALHVEILPHTGSGDVPLVHTGFELVYCLEGVIHYQIEEQNFRLEPGDSIFFEAHLPHCWQNNCPRPAYIFLILCPSVIRD